MHCVKGLTEQLSTRGPGAVQAVGLSHVSKPAAQSWAIDEAPRNGGLAGFMKAGLVLTVLASATLMVVAGSTGGAAAWLSSLVK